MMALQIGMEQNDAVHYKLQIMGVQIDKATDVYCNNEGVVKNTLVKESTLNKKHLSICYHFVMECCAKLAANITHFVTDEMLADIATKILNPRKKRQLTERKFSRVNYFHTFDFVTYRILTTIGIPHYGECLTMVIPQNE